MRFPSALLTASAAAAAVLLSASLGKVDARGSPLTPRNVIEAPRLGAGRASPNGLHALVPVTEHDLSSAPSKLTTHKTVYHLPLPAHIAHAAPAARKQQPTLAKPQPLVFNVSDAFFIGDEEAAFIRDGILYYKNVSEPDLQPYLPGTPIGSFPAPIGVIKAVIPKTGGDKKRTLVFTAEAYDDGSLDTVNDHDESDVEQEWKRVRAYESTFVRHWDKWISNKRSQLFAVDLVRDSAKGTWQFSSGGFRNLFHGLKLETPIYPFGGAEDFDANEDHVVWTSRDPERSAAWNTIQPIYLAPLSGDKPPKKLTSGTHGITASPVLSPDGKSVAWLQMATDGYESDRKVLHFHDLASGKTRQVFKEWDSSPKSIHFTPAGDKLHLLVDHQQKEKIFVFDLAKSKDEEGEVLVAASGQKEPRELVGAVAVEGLDLVLHGGALVKASTLYSSSELYWLAPTAGSKLVQLTHFGKESKALADVVYGPEPEEIKWAGAGGRTAYGWLVKPPGYKPSKKYPLAVLIHGGPESSWTNGWSSRWNPSVFASAGFIVFTPNPAGSTSFGQAYQEEILNSWGGKPYQDIISGVHHVIRVVVGVDGERVVAAGASYGGYSINWLQGHNNDGLFKGLVCHDGVFNTLNTYYSTDEIWFPEAEMGGNPWTNPEAYSRWSPSNHVSNWKTPQLTIHGGKDYRLTESEGLSVFNALQRRGVPSRFLYFPDENHWVLEPRNSLRWHEEVIGWLSKYGNATVPKLSADDEAKEQVQAAGAPRVVFQHGQTQ
ncbi:Dipeptidyl-peptidase 5 [Tilletia horrida]|nr:Dipeptidyl-peptidase 5 [Tilletia horrida]